MRGFSPVSTDETTRQSLGGEVPQIPPTNRRGAPQRGEAVPHGTKHRDSHDRTKVGVRIDGWNAPPGAAERDAEEGRAEGMRGLPRTTGSEGDRLSHAECPRRRSWALVRRSRPLSARGRNQPSSRPCSAFRFLAMASRGPLEAARSAPGQAAATAPSLVSHARQLICSGSSTVPKYLEGGRSRPWVRLLRVARSAARGGVSKDGTPLALLNG